MGASSKSATYEDPIVFTPPRSHTTTLIILHGRGSTAQKFAEPLLTHPISPLTSSESSSAQTLKVFRDYFPNTKFIFPTASKRRAVVFRRSMIHQWFDNWSLTEPELKQHLQIPGLRETSSFLHDLLRKEIAMIGAGNVVLMGLSQGSAASLISSILWEAEPFAAVVGMCGYIPFRKGMLSCVEATEDRTIGLPEHHDSPEDDLFDRGGDEEEESQTKFGAAAKWLREELQIDGTKQSSEMREPFEKPRVFMGHGSLDEKVPCAIGKQAAEFLKTLEVDVTWHEYEGLGHWYSEDMLRDIITFLKGLPGWSDVIGEVKVSGTPEDMVQEESYD